MVNLLTDYTTQIYHALSTDARPAGEPGAQLREIDTGKRYIYDGTSWLELPDGGGGGGGGGISGISVIQDITLSAPVRAVQLNVPAGYDWAVAIIDLSFTAEDWLYWGLNNAAPSRYLPKSETVSQIFPMWYSPLGTGVAVNFQQSTNSIVSESATVLDYLYLRGYSCDFAIGSRFLLIGGHYADL